MAPRLHRPHVSAGQPHAAGGLHCGGETPTPTWTWTAWFRGRGGGLFLTKHHSIRVFPLLPGEQGKSPLKESTLLHTRINLTEFACRMGMRTPKCSQPMVGTRPSPSSPSTVDAGSGGGRWRNEGASPRPSAPSCSRTRLPRRGLLTPTPPPRGPPSREHPSRAALSLPRPPRGQTPAPPPLGTSTSAVVVGSYLHRL